MCSILKSILEHIGESFMNTLQTKRFYEIDFARAVPLIFLPIVHFYEEFGFWGMLSEKALSLGTVWLYLCAFGPSIFMIVLGMNIAFSSHTSPRQLARRGLIILAVFYGLNIVRFFIPGLIGYFVVKDPAVLQSALLSLSNSDILLFAGLCFLFFALMKRLNVTPFYILVISLLLLGIDMLIEPKPQNAFLISVLGHFVYVNNTSCFPLLPWLTYPAVGYILALKMKSVSDEAEYKKLYQKLTVLGIAMMAVLSVCLLSYGIDPLTVGASVINGYLTDLFNIILDTGLAFVWFGIVYYIWASIRSQRVREIIIRFSKSIMIFYIAQWVFVGWSELIFGAFFLDEHCLDFRVIAVCAAITAVICVFIGFKVQAKLDARKAKRYAMQA